MCWVKDMLADGQSCTDGGEGYQDSHNYSLTTEEFVASRDAEFSECCFRLGIKRENIYFSKPRYTDMNFSVEEVKGSIKKVCDKIKPNRVCVHAPRWESSFNPSERNISMPPHVDHCFCGQAVQLLLREKAIDDAEFFIEFYDFERFQAAHKEIRAKRIESTGREATIIQKTGLAYKVWNPQEGRYAIGWHRDKEMHANALKEPLTLSYRLSRARLFASRLKHNLFMK